MTFAAMQKIRTIYPQSADRRHEHDASRRKSKYLPDASDVITDPPGNCPKCGMKLVPIKRKKRSTSNIRNIQHRTRSHAKPRCPCLGIRRGEHEARKCTRLRDSGAAGMKYSTIVSL
jgi:hypothetical protein